MKRKRTRKGKAVEALKLMVNLDGPALRLHRELTADGFTLTQMVTPRRRKDGTFSVRFVWRQRTPSAQIREGVVNTSFSVSMTEEFRVVAR